MGASLPLLRCKYAIWGRQINANAKQRLLHRGAGGVVDDGRLTFWKREKLRCQDGRQTERREPVAAAGEVCVHRWGLPTYLHEAAPFRV